MPSILHLDHAIAESSHANIGTPAASMQAPVPITGDDDFCRLATPVQETEVTLKQRLQQSEQRGREPHSEYDSLAIEVKAPVPESMGCRSNTESAVAGLGNALQRLEQEQTALREKLALPQSARDLLLAPCELSSDDSIVLDGAARRERAICPTPSSSSAELGGIAEPAFSAQPDERCAVLQARNESGVREELLRQATRPGEDLAQDVTQHAGEASNDFGCVGGAVKLPAAKRSHIDTSDARPDMPYPTETDASAAPLHCTAAPTNPLSDRFFDDMPSDVFFNAQWLLASPSDIEGDRPDSRWTWADIGVWIEGIECGEVH